MKRSPTRERSIERYLRRCVRRAGGLCEKHVAPGQSHVPDRLITWPGRMELVETKRPGAKPRRGQLRDHARRRRLGVTVLVLDTREKVDSYIESRRQQC